NLPLAVASLKPEGASDARSVEGVREAVEIYSLVGWDRCRIDTVVSHDRTIDDDLQDLRSLAGAQYVSGRTATILFLTTILEIERLACLAGEVNDNVNAFSHREPGTGYLYRFLDQVAVGRDLPERLGRVVWSKHKHLVEARRSGVQPAETIPAR